MTGRRVEHQHYTSDQVQNVLDEALTIVGALGVSDDLLVPAFTEAVRLLAAKTVTMEEVGSIIDPMAVRAHR